MMPGSKRFATFALAILVACLISTGKVHAQNPDQHNAPDAPHSRFGNPTSIARIYQTYIFGIVKKSEPSDLVLTKTKFGGDQDFKIGKGTKFIRNGKRSARFALKPGEMVWIDMKRNKKTGVMTAKKVAVGAGAAGAPSAD